MYQILLESPEFYRSYLQENIWSLFFWTR